MIFSFDLLINAIVSGILIGAFYAAVTSGITLSFGILDIVNIAHPAFIILGSYIAYIINATFGLDPIITAIIATPAFYALGAGIYQIYYVSFEKRGQESMRGLAFFFGLLFITEVTLVLYFGVDYRYVEAPYIGPTLHFACLDIPLRILVPCLVSLLMIAVLQLVLTRTFIGRAIMAVAQDQLALKLMAIDPIRDQANRLRHFHRHRFACRRFSHHHPAGRAVGWTRIYRPRLRDLRAWRHGQPAGNRYRRHACRHRRKPDFDVLWPVLGARGVIRILAADAGGAAGRPVGTLNVRSGPFLLVCLIVGGIVFAAALALGNDYYFFAGYVVLQYIVLATAWNILGGYCGYVNFGSAAFFALGAYSTVAVHRLAPVPIPVLVAIGGVVSGVVGFGMGYLTLRLRGAFFAIATLALAVVLQTLIVNWDFVGGSRGAYIVRPESIAPFGSYIKYLFLIMMLLAVGSITVGAADRALAARLRIRDYSRRRTGGGGVRRADAAA